MGLLILFALLLWGGISQRAVRHDDGLPLAIRWEGVVQDKNYRDAGESLNSCLGHELFQTARLLRANGWFSGWSCDTVGSPEVIYSLNYAPELQERYFCMTEDGQQNIGRFFNPKIKLNDLELIDTWSNPAMVEGTCGFISDIMQSLIAQKRVLVHCNAGRDRTGTMVAVLAALAAETSGLLDDDVVGAIECDYRKTASLKPQLYGRMAAFIHSMQKEQGSVTAFITGKCGIPRLLLEQGAGQLIRQRLDAMTGRPADAKREK
jgi:hypothetical protein